MGQPDSALKLRMSADLKASIQVRAVANRRSVNSEIIIMLEAAIAADATKSSVSAGDVPGVGSALQA